VFLIASTVSGFILLYHILPKLMASSGLAGYGQAAVLEFKPIEDNTHSYEHRLPSLLSNPRATPRKLV